MNFYTFYCLAINQSWPFVRIKVRMFEQVLAVNQVEGNWEENLSVTINQTRMKHVWKSV